MNSLATWDYAASVEKVRPLVMSWRNLTVEIAEELYRAREELSRKRANVPNGTKTWESYLDDVGLARRTVHRWLERYEPDERRLMEPEEVEERKRIADRAAQDEAVAQRKRVKEAISTGKKPADWDDATEKAYQREIRDRKARRARIAAANAKAEQDEREREAKAEQDEREREAEQKRREEGRVQDEILRKALDAMVDRHEQRHEFKKRIKVSQAGESDMFIDALMDYLDELENDSRRIEVCQNIIKVCRNVAAQLQREA